MKRTAQMIFLATLAASTVLLGFVATTAITGSPARGLPSGPAGGVPYVSARYAAPEGPAYYEKRADTRAPVVTLPNFADIFEEVNLAVVSISATKFNDGGSRGDGERFFEDPFHWFFGPGPNRDPRNRPRREESGGSGFVITPDGYVLTNYHVVEGAERVRVRLNPNGREYEGRVVGLDPPTDIALVKISPAEELAYLPLGRSSDLRVGEWVMAIGNPYFYEDTVTVGVVSAKGRRLTGLSRDPSLDDYIQTDAAINVGNSGGPLLNVRGEVIGINTAVSRIGQGIGFAIPIDMAKAILPQLREEGRVTRGAIGVRITDIAAMDPDQREYFGLKDVNGALVQEVVPGQPAAKADVRPGDAIISIDGEDLGGSDDLIARISAKRPGESVDLVLLRHGRRHRTRVRLEDRQELWYEETSTVQREQSSPRRMQVARSIGIAVEDVDAATRRTFDMDDDVSGVVITNVSVRGQGYEKGLRPGMLILEVNRERVREVDDYLEILEKVEAGDLVTFYVQRRNGLQNFVTFRVEK